jgi:hypothetical protein
MHIVFFESDIPDRCGAFYSDLCLAKELKARGHTVFFISCALPKGKYGGGEYEGFQWKPAVASGKELDQSQIWISPHYPHGNVVRKLNQAYKRPIIFTLHFAGAAGLFNVPFPVTWPETIWYVNSYIPKMLNNKFPGFVVNHGVRSPFIDAAPILLTEPGTHEYITLVNANMIKGLPQFLKIAKQMPDHKFLGIRSFYHPPTDSTLEVPPNITWIDFTRDVKSIYARTRIMLILSGTESFCITAAESMLNGIPVLYSEPTGSNYNDITYGTTEGVRAWIDPVGIALPRNDTTAWVNKLLELDDETVYSQLSVASRIHAKPVFGTAGSGIDYITSFASKYPVKPNSLMSIRHETRQTGSQPSIPVVPQKPSQPAAWKNGRLTFGKR